MKDYNKQYRETHKEELKNYEKNYYAANKEKILKRANDYYHEHADQIKQQSRKYNAKRRSTNLTYESFAETETPPEYASAATYITENTDGNDKAHDQFTELLKNKGLTDEEINKAYGLARQSMMYRSSQRGYRFESAVRAVLLKELTDTPYKLYKQVPINNYTCKIDFVITKEETDDKATLHLENAIIVSTKTATGTSWREDMHLYDKCKKYVMLTIETEYPMEQLPDNVYFASPNISEDAPHKLTLNSMFSLMRSTLEE